VTNDKEAIHFSLAKSFQPTSARLYQVIANQSPAPIGVLLSVAQQVEKKE